MKSYGVTIQMKPIQHYIHMVLFIQYVVQTFESVDEILWCDHSNDTSSAVLSNGAIYLVCSMFSIQYVVLTFDYLDEILWCHYSNETSSAVPSHGTNYLVCSSNF